MKVVLFCGGQGLRLPRHSETIPKPMAIIGYRPILWHVMRYYAHHGQSDFLLCLGYRGDLVKSYFLAYNDALSYQPDGMVTGITDVKGADLWVNGGYFFFRREIFDYLREGEDLVKEPFQRLMAARELITYRYEGFWTALDTLKDLQNLESLHDSGHPPWAPWTSSPSGR